MEKDIVTLKLPKGENLQIDIGTSSIIGTRSSQEDTVFAYENGPDAIAVVCDGMGGMENGCLASKTAVESLVDAWFDAEEIPDIPLFLQQEAIRADEKVFFLEDENGEPLHSGTTMVAVILRNGQLFWLSVGDSRIYIIRGNEIMAVNRDHNYRLTLEQQLELGEITQEEYEAEEYRAEALISYLGMGDVSLMDRNLQPFELKAGDVILLSSDGLYRSLTDEQIFGIIKNQEGQMQAAAETLTAAALGDKTSGQDNTSVVAVRVTEGLQNNFYQEEFL